VVLTLRIQPPWGGAPIGLPPVRRKKRYGRRPRKGKRLPAPVELAKHINKKWTSVGTNERAKDSQGLLWAGIVLWYKASHDPVLLVISRDPAGKEKGDFFFTTDVSMAPHRSNRDFRWQMVHRGHLQEYQTISRHRGTAMLEGAGPRTSGDHRTGVVFADLGVVSVLWPAKQLHHPTPMVSCQDAPEFSGRSDLPAAGAVAPANYYPVRKTGRTSQNLQNLQIPYPSPRKRCIINNQKCAFP